MTVKERILIDIEQMNNEELLQDVYALVQDLKEINEMLVLNNEQIIKIELAQNQFKSDQIHNHDDLFKELLSE
ncbi:MAG: hypothetical protein ABIO44_01565 [Saprospiraceae bacterium]